jgi:hypothetical protein
VETSDAMTEIVQKAVSRLMELDEPDQETMAEWILEMIEAGAYRDGEDDDDGEVDPVESFREAWQDMKAGRVMTHEEFLKAVGRGD